MSKKLIYVLAINATLFGCGGGGELPAPAPPLASPTSPTPLNGQWNGIATQGIGAATRNFNFQLSIAENSSGQVVGTSKVWSVENPAHYAVQAITGRRELDQLTFSETSFVENFPQPGSRWCVKSTTLRIDGSGLQGDWSAPGCTPGRFYLVNSGPLTRWFERLPDCPCTHNPSINGRSDPNKLGALGRWSVSTTGLDIYHPGAKSAVRWGPDSGGSGQQCTYDASNKLITGGLGAGTPDFVSSEDSVFLHWMEDVLSFESSRLAAILTAGSEQSVFTCKQYFDLYPPNQGRACTSNTVNVPLISRAEVETCRTIIDSFPK